MLYKTGTGVMIVLLTSLVAMAFSLWAASRIRLAFGALTILFVLGDGMIAAALTNDRPVLLVHLAMAAVAGFAGDVLLWNGRRREVAIGLPSLATLRAFGIVVPLAYYGTFWAVTIPLEGTWWNWSLIAGTLVWSVLCGYGLTFVMSEPPALLPASEVSSTTLSPAVASPVAPALVRS